MLRTQSVRFQILDLLRAYAIISVIGFHFLGTFIKSGYIGVDVFFVVSGFLISQRITTINSPTNYKWIFTFWQNRFSRLFAPALPPITVTFLFYLFTADYPSFIEVCKEIFASLLGFANLYFYSTDGYFAKSSLVKPLLHFWSLSIEIQFYFVAPIIAFTFLHSTKLRKVFIGILLLNFITVIYLIFPNFATSYFSTFARFAEIAVGVLVNKVSSKKFTTSIKRWQLITALIFLSIAPFSNLDQSFLLVLHFVVLISTSIIILYSLRIRYSFNGVRFLVRIGNASYSIYLWHWILIVIFYRMNLPNSFLIAFVLSCVLGILSYELIDKRINIFRNFRNFLVICLIHILLIIFSYGFYVGKLETKRLEISRIKYRNSIFDTTKYESKPCETVEDTKILHNYCTIWNPTDYKSTILLWGDSFSNSWVPAFLTVNKDRSVRIIQISHAACPPLLGVVRIGDNFGQAWCNNLELKDEIRNFLISTKINKIFLIARWNLYTKGLFKAGKLVEHSLLGFPGETFSSERGALKALEYGLQENLQLLSGKTQWIIFEQTPTFRNDISMNNNFENQQLNIQEFRYQTVSENKIFQGFTDKGLAIVKPSDYVCDEYICNFRKFGFNLFVDDAHPSLKYVLGFAPFLRNY